MKWLTAITLFLIIILGLYFNAYYSSVEELNITITDKWIKGTSEGQKYLFTDGIEVFENTDELPFGKWDSSDFWVKIKVGNTYKMTVVGWRIPLFSMYKNVIKIEDI